MLFFRVITHAVACEIGLVAVLNPVVIGVVTHSELSAADSVDSGEPSGDVDGGEAAALSSQTRRSNPKPTNALLAGLGGLKEFRRSLDVDTALVEPERRVPVGHQRT
jgi:hypothetical protein